MCYITKEKEKNMDEKINVLISKEEVENRIQEIADEISAKYAGKVVHQPRWIWRIGYDVGCHCRE